MKTIEIKKTDKRKTYLDKLKKLSHKGLDTKKYSGKLKITDNPVDIQRRLRDEWK